MRILSQDIPMIDAFDIPYEMSMLSMSKYMAGRYRIYAQGAFIGNTSHDNFVLMAEYSTEEKARKAMEMLREEYTGTPSIRRMDDLYGRFKHTGKKDFELFIEHMVLKKCYFQFPADDEVEA